MQITKQFVRDNSAQKVLDATTVTVAALEARVQQLVPQLAEKSRKDLAKLAGSIPDILGKKFYVGDSHTLLRKVEKGATAVINTGTDTAMERFYPLFLSYFKLNKHLDQIVKPFTQVVDRLRNVLAAISCGIANRDFKKPGDAKSGFHKILYEKLTKDVGDEFFSKYKIGKPGSDYDINTFFSF